MSGDSQARFVATCKCGAKLKVPVSAAGRKAKCPKCENIFVIPQHKVDKPAKVKSDFDPFDDGTFGLEELAAMEKSAPAIETSTDGAMAQPCPKCNSMMGGGATLCVNCGYNCETGKTAKRVSAEPGKLASLTLAFGPFMLGTIYSCIGALVGAAIWFGIVLSMGYEIGWIAWGVGALAGYGMMKGYDEGDSRAGLTAAGISAFGIVAAKAAVFVFVIQAVFTGNTNDIELQRQFVALNFTEKIFSERDIYSEEEREAQWEATFAEGESKASFLTDDEIRRRTIRLRAEESYAYTDEESTVIKQLRLCQHKVDMEAEALGLEPSCERREMLLDTAFEEISHFSPQELDSALVDKKKWQDTDRWLDAAYVQHRLIYRFVEKKISDKYKLEQSAGNEAWKIDARQWEIFRRDSSAEVEKLTNDDRLAQLHTFEDEDEYMFVPENLAQHYADLLAQKEGLSFTHDKRSSIYDEELKRFSAMSHEALDIENEKLEAWNNGDKWHDANYVYNALIYHYATEDLSVLRQEHMDDDDYWEPSESDWQFIHANAKKKTDGIPTHRYQSKVQEFESARSEKIKKMVQQYVDNQTTGIAVTELADGAFSVFIETMWSPMDAFFLLLAVSSAYKIASGFGEYD